MLHFLLALLLLTGAGEARAQFWLDCEATYLAATPLSYHTDRSKDYREQHLGIGIEKVCGDVRGAAGVIPRNSNNDTTVYFVGAWMPVKWRELRGGLFGGLFTGYSKPILPAGGLIGAWEPERLWRLRNAGLNLLWFPPVDDDNKRDKGVFILQLKRKF